MTDRTITLAAKSSSDVQFVLSTSLSSHIYMTFQYNNFSTSNILSVCGRVHISLNNQLPVYYPSS
jgi:hypothetical protein